MTHWMSADSATQPLPERQCCDRWPGAVTSTLSLAMWWVSKVTERGIHGSWTGQGWETGCVGVGWSWGWGVWSEAEGWWWWVEEGAGGELHNILYIYASGKVVFSVVDTFHKLTSLFAALRKVVSVWMLSTNCSLKRCTPQNGVFIDTFHRMVLL